MPEIITSGYLYREEFKKWHKYYFEMNALRQMRCYANEKRQKYKSTISLKTLRKIGLTDDHNGKKNILVLAMKDNSTHVFSAENNSVRVKSDYYIYIIYM